MSRRNNLKQSQAKAQILKELKEAGLQVAATRTKPSEIPYYSSVSSTQKRVLVVK